MNDDKGTRANALEELDQQFEEAKVVIYSDAKDLEKIESSHKFTEEDESNPFLAPAIRATRGIDTPRDDEGTVKQIVKSNETEIDQA